MKRYAHYTVGNQHYCSDVYVAYMWIWELMWLIMCVKSFLLRVNQLKNQLEKLRYVVVIIIIIITSVLQPRSSLDNPDDASLAVSWHELFSSVRESVSRQPDWWIRPPYLCPLETVWSSYTPKFWVSIIVASYDTHGLRWGYSCSLPQHGKFYLVNKTFFYNKPV